MLRRIISRSDLHQGSRDDPHHIVKETISPDPQCDPVSLSLYLCVKDGAYGRLYLSACPAEALKVMLAFQKCGCLPHLLRIQGHIGKMRIKPLCRNRESPVQDPVFIGLLTVPVAGMKIQRHFLGLLIG